MAQILQFPAVKPSAGPVYCEPHNIFFPQVIRIVQNLTSETLAKTLSQAAIVFGDPAPIEPGVYVDYDLCSKRYLNVTSWSPVDSIDPSEMTDSIFIRYHETKAEARAYFLAHMDLSFDPDAMDFSRGPDTHAAERGAFTFARRPTLPTWPGPLICYLARLGQDMLADTWCQAVAPGGEVVDAYKLEII